MKYISGNLSEEDYTNLLKTFDPTEEDVLDKKLPHVGLKGGSKFFGNCIFGFKFQTSSPNTQIQIIPQGMEVKKVLIDGEKVEPENNSYTFSNEGTHVVKIFSSDIWTSIEGTFINGWTNLKEIEFPSSIEDFDSDSIVGCSGLEKLKFGKKIQEINGDLSTLGLREIEISERNRNLKVIEGKYIVAREHPDNLLGTIENTIPTSPQIKKFNEEIYAGKTLTNFVIPGNIEELGESAFEGCTFIGSLTLGEGLEKIGSKAFYSIDISELDTLIIKPTTPPTIIDPEYFDLRDIDENGDPISGVELEVIFKRYTYYKNNQWKNLYTCLLDENMAYFTPLTFTAIESGTFSIYIPADGYGMYFKISQISYSTDNGDTWTTNIRNPNSSTTITTPTISAGNKVLWKGKIEGNIYTSSGPGLQIKFSSTGRFNISGNLGTLFVDEITNNSPIPGRGIGGLFQSCTKLISARDLVLPFSLVSSCYQYMFKGCTSLTTAPELPATTLDSYCYDGMFYGCTSLVTAPELPATTLVSGCYNCMFRNCSSLKFISVKCTSFPEHSGMSSHCTYWVQGVSSSGILVRSSSATWETTEGTSSIPTGWTVVNEVEYLNRDAWGSGPLIDMGIYGNLNTELGVTYMSTGTEGSQALAGSRGTDNNITLFTGTGNNDQRFGDLSVKVTTTVNVKYTATINKTHYVRSDDVDLALGYNTAFTTDTTLKLFGWNKDSYGIHGHIYSAYVKQDGELIRDLIPVRQGTTGYMCDRVSGQLFGNVGSGNFTLGPDL